MEYSVQVKVATISLWNYGALLVNVAAFGLLYLKANKNKVLKTFFIVQAAMMIWLIGKVFKTVSPTEGLRWAFIVFYYFGVCLLEVSFFDFSYVYNKGHHLKKTFRILLYGLGFAQFMVVLTNPIHYKFYSVYGFWGDDFGPLFYVHVVINYAMIIAGMVLCSKKYSRLVRGQNPFRRFLIAFAITIALVLNLVYISGMLGKLFRVLGIQIFDITPLAYSWSLLIFVYATFRYAFFDLSPIMKHQITKHLKSPVLVVDSMGNELYANKAMTMMPHRVESAILLRAIEQDGLDDIRLGDRYVQCSVVEVKQRFDSYYLLAFNDVTSLKEGQLTLADQNRALAINREKLEEQIEVLKGISRAGAGNYVARELHDIVGHGLVVTMKLMEVCKLYRRIDRQRAMESLNRASEVLCQSFEEMKTVKDGKAADDAYTYESLKKELGKMLKAVEISGMKVNYYPRGRDGHMDALSFDIVRKVTTELVTNTLKHSEADQILLSLDSHEAGVRLNYMDNGKGCDQLIKGNGLEGIESRLALKGGRMKLMTAAGEGFNCLIEL